MICRIMQNKSVPDQMFYIFVSWKIRQSSAWGSQTTSIEALESQTQHKSNCFSVKAKFKLFFRQTSCTKMWNIWSGTLNSDS